MFHGTSDRIVEVAQSVEFRDSLVAHAKSVQLEIVADADHVYEFQNSQPLGHFNWNQWSTEGEVSRDSTIAWLSRTLQVNDIHCPNNKSYWKNHAAQWNADAIPMKLGTTNYYTKPQLLSILNTAAGNDPSRKLAQQLIAAKLNLANNSYASPIASTIIAADNLIGNRAIPIVPAIASNSSQGNQMNALGNTLNAYNNGTLTPNCNNGGNKIAQNNSSRNNLLIIYPNPATNSVTIKIPSDDAGEIQIVNAMGRVVETHCNASLHDAEIQIDVTKYPTGIYVIRWSSGVNIQTNKLSVIH